MITWEDIEQFVKDNQDKYIKDVLSNINPKFEPYKFSDLYVWYESYVEHGDIGLNTDTTNCLVEDPFGFDLFSIRGGNITYLGCSPQYRLDIDKFPNVILSIMTYGKEDLV